MPDAGHQPNLGLMPPFVNSNLFSDHLLRERLPDLKAWGHWSNDGCRALHEGLEKLLAGYLKTKQSKNEADTRKQWLDEVIKLLGFECHTETKLRAERPDYVLFEDRETHIKASAALQADDPNNYYSLALTILEAKYWGRPLQRTETSDKDPGNPVLQINRYLDNAHIFSNNKIQWAILSNGQCWRLYWRGSPSRASTYLELDLVDLIQNPHEKNGDYARFRLFPLLFSSLAFIRDNRNLCALDELREAAQQYAIELGNSMEEAIYDENNGAFINLARGLYRAATRHGTVDIAQSPLKDLNALAANTLVLLYRLLFILYAEDRDLLPVKNPDYRTISLKKLRSEIAATIDREHIPKGRSTAIWGRLESLFALIHGGDPELDLPFYDGGLFDPQKHPALAELKIPDSDFIPALDSLSRVQTSGSMPLMVDYKDLGVRQLGSLYEGLLEYGLTMNGKDLAITQDSLARRTSASYYTDDDLVSILVRETLGPIVQERKKIVDGLFSEWRDCRKRLKKTKNDFLLKLALESESKKLSPKIEELLLNLKILDPAMGSGHFLVSALNYLTDSIMAILAEQQEELRNAKVQDKHPIMAMLDKQRVEMMDSLHNQKMTLEAMRHIVPFLDDLSLLKRILMKRCFFGVDINPLAVELTKLSLWLDSFTLGAPLCFLDHHLKVGNSLVGSTLERFAKQRVDSQGFQIDGTLFTLVPSYDAPKVIKTLRKLITNADISVEGVARSHFFYDDAEHGLKGVRVMLDIATSRYFSNPPRKSTNRKNRQIFDDAKVLLADDTAMLTMDYMLRNDPGTKERLKKLPPLFLECIKNAIKDRHNHSFFHWELAFPAVLYPIPDPGLLEPDEIGFDAVITNPPWERIKLQENEFFAAARPDISRMQTQAQRKEAIAKLPKQDPELWQRYQHARQIREELLNYCHGDDSPYPLLGGGDTNLYSLMVELSLGLLKKDGRAGFVVPSGICMDKGSAAFFSKMTADRRMAFIYDFENKKTFFPSVDSRFKFCLIGFTGTGGNGQNIPTAFFLHSVEQIPDRTIHLSPGDFELFNPNTKTCPVFRTCRDHKITKKVYERVPILKRHSPEENPWRFTYKRMFDMTNDSGLFKTLSQLDEMDAWREAGGLPIYGSPKGRFLPLYEGKMVQAYNPRAASVVVNLNNLYRPAQPSPSKESQLQNPAYFPQPQYWVFEQDLRKRTSSSVWEIAIKNISSPTNVRTLILSAIPAVGVGNSIALLRTDLGTRLAFCFLANFNSIMLDYIARLKIGGQTLNLFILEQLPTLPPDFYSQTLHGRTWESLIAPRAFELSYTCDALKPMADAYGHDGPPSKWDVARRRALQAQLDALFFLAYGFDTREDEGDIAHVFGAFPILNSQDPSYADLVMGYARAYRAGEMDAEVEG